LGVIDHPNDILMDLHEPKMVPDANCGMLLNVFQPPYSSFPLVLLPEQPRNIHSDKIEIRSSPQTSGVGVFVRKDCSLDPGDIATEYGGTPSWKTPQQVSELIKKKRNPYVFTIGPFELRNTKHRKYLLCWDGGTLGYDCHTTNCGHLLNTSHPRLLAPWDKENCMFALYLNDLKLTYTPPKAKLYVMVTHNIDGGLGSNPLYELRLDYHSVLASEFGFWCLELGCKECVENLMDFVDTFLRPSTT
jgi:hypothetical protein